MNVARLLERLKAHEGFSARPYRDTVGKLTIGYGRNLDDVGISPSEARQMLQHDAQEAIDDAQEEWSDLWPNLDSIRQEVLVELTYNMGRTRFSRARWPGLTEALKAKDYVKAGDEMMDSRWATQVKGRAATLAALMRSGDIKDAE